MHLKIFFADKAVYLTDALTDELKEILTHPDAVFVDELSNHAIHALLHEIKKPEFHAGVILHNDLAALRQLFFKQFTFIEAAGGVVLNENRDLLFIYRLDRWDLPKGKMEAGESPEICAEREITEETGVTHLTLKKKIADTYHTYEAFGKHFLKQTHWFYFTCSGEQTLVPQTEEQIAEIRWFHTKDIRIPVAKTYPAIKDILRTFFDTP